MAVWPALILFWSWMWRGCDMQHQAEEVEIFHSDKQTRLLWNSDPPRQWSEVMLKLGTQSAVPVLQACGRTMTRSILSRWMERKDAHYLLMDVSYAQEEEPSSQLGPLQVHLSDSDNPVTTLTDSGAVLNLQTSKPLPVTFSPNQITSHLNRTRALGLGPVSRQGFQLAFSYSGTCVLITSIRLYYRRCPDSVAQLALFKGTGAVSGPVTGSCVKGAVEVVLPVRECNLDGVWGPLQGECSCEPGHQVMDDSCQACRIGYYKPANDSRECQLCPPNSRTGGEGSERCDCLEGFSRLPTDPDDLGCTKPPSAPVNLTAHHHNDSVLIMTWEPPHDLGGRHKVKYGLKCERKKDSGHGWEACGDHVVEWLTDTSVSVTQLNPQCDYRFSVQAWNDVSTLQTAPPSSTATFTMHRWKVPPVLTTVKQQATPAPPQRGRHFFIWLTACVLFGVLLLMTVILTVVCVLRNRYTKLKCDQEIELLPVSAEFSYRRPQEVEAKTHTANSVVQLLEGFSSRLLSSLQDVLVERDRLTLGKELGKGEFGSVYEGIFSTDRGVDIKVAVKTMRVGIHCQEDLHEFLREAELMKNFDHENVVRLLGVTLEREQDSPLPVPLVILPYMQHGDLRSFLIATRYGHIPMLVPHQSLLRFMIDIAAGMDYLSLQGFLHRDLAARNCMLGDDLRVCVADFGLSKKIYSSNYYRQNVTIRVPIKWMAMESLSESVYTAKSDVWSFGITMWEIVCRGRTPYPGVHNSELLDLLLSGHRLKPPKDCDHQLYEVMLSCWNKDPSCRPGFRELAETLKALLSKLPVVEASQEVIYINQSLKVAAAATAATCQDPETDSGGRWGNIYVPGPLEAAALKDEEEEVEDGYLKYIPPVKGDDNT